MRSSWSIRCRPSRRALAARLALPFSVALLAIAVATSITTLLLGTASAESARSTYRSPHFIVEARSEREAKAIARAAEAHLERLSHEWFGAALGSFNTRVLIVAQPGEPNRTTFTQGEVRIEIDPRHPELFNGLIPHELMHALLRRFLGTRVPPWINEGIACAVEDERARARRAHRDAHASMVLLGKPFSFLHLMEFNPRRENRKLLYVRGARVTEFLIEQGGRDTILRFLRTAVAHGDDDRWEIAAQRHYGRSLYELEQDFWRWHLEQEERADSLPNGVTRISAQG